MAGVAAGAEDDGVDHYAVLGLPSGEEGAVLTLKEIEKAYKSESRRRHPDKRPDDPDATADFQRLKASYEFLCDEPRRAAFDARLRSRRDRALRDSALDSRRRKLAADLEERERAAAEGGAVDPAAEAARREKKVAADLKRELDEFNARKSKKARSASAEADSAKTSGQENREENEGVALDKEKMLRVSWEKGLGDYGAAELREIFRRFGVVEDVVIRSKGSRKKSKGSAIVVMSSKDAAVSATRNVCGSLSNPLLVLPFETASSNMSSSFPEKCAEPDNPKLSNIIGARFKDYEASIMEKLQKANERKKSMQSNVEDVPEVTT